MRSSREKAQRLSREFCTDGKGGLSSEERRQLGVGWVWGCSHANPDGVGSRTAMVLTIPAPGEGLGSA